MVPTTSLNAYDSMLVIDVDCISITKSGFVQPRNVYLGIDVIFLGIFIVSNDVQILKQLEPNVSIVSGNNTLFNDAAPINALSDILVYPSGTTTETTDVF